LQNAQQLALDREGQGGHIVEQQRASVSLDEPAGLALAGAGLGLAEQFTLGQGLLAGPRSPRPRKGPAARDEKA